MAAGATPTINTRIAPESLRKLLADVKTFDAGLSRALRMRLRLAGAEAVADIRKTVREPTPGGTPAASGDVRDQIASGTKVSILAGKRIQGVRITSTSTRLAAANKAMLKAYNTKSWRHPSYRSGDIVVQPGRPFFGAVVMKRKLEMQRAVNEALVDAARAIH